jgi:hypothetical protein
MKKPGLLDPGLRSRAEGRIRTYVFHPGGVLLLPLSYLRMFTILVHSKLRSHRPSSTFAC